MEDLGIMVGRKTQAVHPLGKAEDALGDLSQLKIRTQQLVIDLEHRVLLLVAVVGVIPWHDFHRLTFEFTGKSRETLHLSALDRQIGITQAVQHMIDVGGCLRHRVLQFIVGIGLAAHQPGNLQACVGDVAQHIQITEFALGTLAVIHQIQSLAQVAAVAVFHEGTITGRFQRHQPSIIASLVLGSLFGSIKGAFGQTAEIIFSEPHFIA